MYELEVETEFSAAHRLRGYEGQCERLHGHNYLVRVTLGCERLNSLGMVMDFVDLKTILREITDRLDHRFLNEVEPFERINPTAEQIAAHIAEALTHRLPGGVCLRKVTCWESGRCGASYLVRRTAN